MTFAAWLRYLGAWVVFIARLGFWVALAAAGLWWGYQAGGWLGLGLAVALLLFAMMLSTEEGRDQIAIWIGYAVAFALVAAIVVALIVGVGYLFGVGFHLAR